jgi:superfamily II DNA or RNA helicase
LTSSCKWRCWARALTTPPLSVAAIFRPFRSLSPYVQVTGRIMRVNVPKRTQPPRRLRGDRVSRRAQHRTALGRLQARRCRRCRPGQNWPRSIRTLRAARRRPLRRGPVPSDTRVDQAGARGEAKRALPASRAMWVCDHEDYDASR